MTLVPIPATGAGPWDLLRAEIGAVVRLATPVVLVQLGMMTMGTVDTLMLGRVSAEALASGSLGNTCALGLLILPFGILMGLDPLVAQSYGAGDHDRIAQHFGRGLALAVALAAPLSLLMWETTALLEALGQRGEVLAGGVAYVRGIVPGNAAFLLFVVVRQTLQAMSIVRPALIAIVVANVANAIANYALIFGKFGFPALGVVGAAYSTSIVRWVMLATLVAVSGVSLKRYWGGLTWRALSPRAHRQQLRIGIPIGFQLSFEVWVFAGVALMMGTLGTRPLAGHQIAITLASLSFMVPLGIGAAAATRVGNAIGRREMAAARRSAIACLGLGGGIMGLFGLVFWMAPRWLSQVFTTDPHVIRVAAMLLPIAALFQVVDGIQVVAGGVLRGCADTRVPALLSFVGYWLVGLPLAALFAFPLEQGARGLWWGVTLALTAVAVLQLLRIRYRFTTTIVALGAEPRATSGLEPHGTT